jgi:hypothetical protein
MMLHSARARRLLIALLLALSAKAELPGKGVITHAKGSAGPLALGGRMLAVVAARSITMLDLETATESCQITFEGDFTMACGGDAVVTHEIDTNLLQIWDSQSGLERERRILDLGSEIHMRMGVGNERYVGMLWRSDHACAGVFDLESGRLHPIRARDIGELLGVDPDCRHLLIRRQEEIYRVDLPRPLPKRLDATALVSGRPDAWLGGGALVVDGHLVDLTRQLIAQRPSRGDFLPSLQLDRYGWFDNGRRLFHVYRFDGSPVVSIPLGRTGHPACLTHDRLVMRQRNEQRIYPLTVKEQERRYLQPGDLWVARLKVADDAEYTVPPGMAVDLNCHSLIWRVPADYAREPFQVQLASETFVVDPLRERSLPDLIRYLWLRLYFDVRDGNESEAKTQLAALLPHITDRTAVPLTLTHMAKTPLGDNIRSQLAPRMLAGNPLAANLLLADVAARQSKPDDSGRYLLAALASRPILSGHDAVVARVLSHYADSAVLPPEIAEFADDLRAKLADVDARLTRRYSELRRWLEERAP